MGMYTKYYSLTLYSGDIVVNIVIISLIIIGGIGFWVWEDIYNNGLKFYKYRLHTKIVIVITLLLIIIPAFIFYGMEKNNMLEGMGHVKSLLISLFQVTT